MGCGQFVSSLVCVSEAIRDSTMILGERLSGLNECPERDPIAVFAFHLYRPGQPFRSKTFLQGEKHCMVERVLITEPLRSAAIVNRISDV